MGCHMSKKTAETNLHYTTIDSTLHARTTHVISTIAAGVEVRALSFESLREDIGCLLDMKREVVKVIFECKKDIWRNQELFKLVEEYFENSLRTLDFCNALEKCLKRVKDTQLLMTGALQQFEVEDGLAEFSKYSRTLEHLKKLRASENPFTEEFFQIFQSVYKQHASMLEKLKMRKSKMDKKLKYIHAWRKVSGVIFVATFASVLICSVVAAAVAAPPVAAALAAASSIPLGSMGKWVDSMWKSYENALRGQKEIMSTMQVVTDLVVKDLDNIRVMIERLKIEIEALMQYAEFAIEEEGAVKLAIGEIKGKRGMFIKSVEDLGVHADVCIRDIRRARTVVLGTIIKHPKTS